VKPIVLLDVDGVLADFVGASLRFLRDRFGLHYTPEQVTEWNLERALKLEPHVYKALCAEFEREDFCTDIEPYPGAVDGVWALRDAGCRVLAVTAPWWSSPTWVHDRSQWLVQHLGFRRDDLHHTSNKASVRGDVLVEDKPETIAAWKVEHPMGAGILWDRPHNRTWPATDMVRTTRWDDVLRIADLAARERAEETRR